MKINKNEQRDIINVITNKFMNVWDDEFSRYEISEEYKIFPHKIVNIDIYEPDYLEYGSEVTMHISLHDSKPEHMTWRYESEFTIGRVAGSDYDLYYNWKCDNTVKSFIKNALNKIFNGLKNEDE